MRGSVVSGGEGSCICTLVSPPGPPSSQWLLQRAPVSLQAPTGQQHICSPPQGKPWTLWEKLSNERWVLRSHPARGAFPANSLRRAKVQPLKLGHPLPHSQGSRGSPQAWGLHLPP